MFLRDKLVVYSGYTNRKELRINFIGHSGGESTLSSCARNDELAIAAPIIETDLRINTAVSHA